MRPSRHVTDSALKIRADKHVEESLPYGVFVVGLGASARGPRCCYSGHGHAGALEPILSGDIHRSISRDILFSLRRAAEFAELYGTRCISHYDAVFRLAAGGQYAIVFRSGNSRR